MSAHDVVPVALTRYCVFVSCGELSCEPYKKGEWADYDEAQATVDALQKRIDELTRVSRELCNVDRLHDLIDETFLTAHGELYEQIAARNALVGHYTKHYAAAQQQTSALCT